MIEETEQIPHETSTGKALCGAKSRTGKPCKFVAEPCGKCRFHGGASLKGIDSPRFKHGMASKYKHILPERMADRYQELLDDPELMALREDIALVQARKEDLLSRVDVGEAGKIYQDILDLCRRADAARASHDYIELNVCMGQIKELADKGNTDFQAWNEVLKLSDNQRRLVDTETKRLQAMKSFVTVEQSIALVASCQFIMLKLAKQLAEEHNTDPTDIIRTIEKEFDQLKNRRGDERVIEA